MNIRKDVRILALLGLVFLAFVFLLSPTVMRKPGVIVTHVEPGSACSDIIKEGSVIKEIVGKRVNSPEEFARVTENLEGPITLLIDNNPRSCTIKPGASLNMSVMSRKTRVIRMGTDIHGGIRMVLKPDGNLSSFLLEETVDKLLSRAKLYGISDVNIGVCENDSVCLDFAPEDEIRVRKIVQQGVVDAVLVEEVKLEDMAGNLVIDDKSFDVKVKDDIVEVAGIEHKLGEWFKLNGINVRAENITGNSTIFLMKVFDDRDVTLLSDVKRRSSIIEEENDYIFVVRLTLSDNASKKFARVTKGREIMIGAGGAAYLKAPMLVLLDDKPVTSFPIPQKDAGREIKSMAIWGLESTKSEALNKALMLITVLETERLPGKFKIIRLSPFRPQKEWIINVCSLALASCIGLMGVVGIVKYHKPRFVLLMMLTLMSEIILLSGVASSQVFAFLVLVLSMSMAMIKGDVYGYRWVNMLLLFIVCFGLVANRWIIDARSLAGVVLYMCVSSAYCILLSRIMTKADMSLQKRYKSALELLWKPYRLGAPVLFVLFLLNPTKSFAMSLAMGMVINSMLTKPVYVRLATIE